MNPDELIASVEWLLAAKPDPTPAELRRSVSTLYYALFHEVVGSFADALAGSRPDDRSGRAWAQVYRSLDHRFVNRATDRALVEAGFPAGIRAFLYTLASMQEHRTNCDYSPNHQVTPSEVLELVQQVRLALADYRACDAKDVRALAILSLLSQRR